MSAMPEAITAAAEPGARPPEAGRDPHGGSTAVRRRRGADMMPTVLLIDDEVRSLDAMRRTLEEAFTSEFKGLKVIIAEGECQLERQRRIKPWIAGL